MKMREIAEIVAEKHGLTYSQLVRGDRSRKFSWARQEAMWLMKKYGNWSWMQMATCLGLSDHTTVIHGVEAYERRLMDARAKIAPVPDQHAPF